MGAGLNLGDYLVTAREEDVLHCGSWTFDRVTGLEIDRELGFGPGGRIGTWLRHPPDEDDR